ncbi:MAG: hypothetical protein GY884_27120, partial [Proteobacteria bacterium]|nr:hypothetical protein [Pseudomonadota bacterium]
GADFDRDEVWVWKPDEQLRAVNLSGMSMIDPTRTALPEAWRGGTTMLAPPGSTLTLEVTRRGEPEPAPNQVSLSRTIWLDLDGDGYTIKDRLSGQMRQGWRMNYIGQGELGRASDTSSGSDLLITTDPEDGETGVELRSSAVTIEAEIRAQQGHGTFDAVGWDHDVQRLDTTLHLPPGWSVLAARGVDELPGTWVDSWSLFEFFLLIMIAFSMGRLFGWPWGVISALALLVSHEWRADAPYYIWFHLVAG